MESWDTPQRDQEESESSPEATPPETASSQSDAEATSSESSSESAEPGMLTGTSSELEPGVGGDASHPAPAAIMGEDGQIHVAGEPPVGTIAPSLPQADPPPSGPTDPEALEALNEVKEPEQIETERPDIGTE